MADIRLGSTEAFRALMKRWQGPLRRFFTLMGMERYGTEDCVQETFLRVFSYRERYRSLHSGFRAFLFRLGRNVSIDAFRRSGRERQYLPLDPDVPTEDRALLWDDSMDCQWALSLLPDRLRIVVVLNVFEGLSYSETAQVLGIPVGTVKSRMNHALQQLRKRLGARARS